MSTPTTITGAHINAAAARAPRMAGAPRIKWTNVPDSYNINATDAADSYMADWLLPDIALAQKRPTDIACWGDSLTNGYGAGSSALTYYSVLSSLYGGKRAVFNGAFNGGTSSGIRTTFESYPLQYSAITVIWAGNNNVLNDEGTGQSKVDVAAMISALPHTNFLVLGNVCGNWGADYYLGGSVHTRVLALNQYWANLYGEKFVDVFSFLVNRYDPLQAGDVTDFGNRIIPRSLRVDEIHLNATGYNLVGRLVYQYIRALYP